MFNSSLFQPNSVDDHMLGLRKKMVAEIDRIPVTEIIQANPEELGAEIAAKYQATCPVLSDDIAMDEPPFTPGSDVTQVMVYVPFTGDKELFQCSGGSAPIITQPIQVQPNQLVIPMRVERTRIAEMEQQVLALVKRIRDEGLGPIRQKLNYFNPDMKNWAAKRIRERQTEHASHQSLVAELHKTRFTLRRRNDGKESLIIPVKPTVIKTEPKPATPLAPAPEPELSLADYDAILQVIRDMVSVFERSPSVFRTMEEEHLRTILLVALNGIFRGAATGETFNGAGKTDILIRENNNNLFIAECLIWDGPEHFRKKLTEQLFNYSTWRDSKLAALVFNRKKNFSQVVQRMKEVVGGLDNCISEMAYNAPTACRHKCRRKDDPQKRFVLTCLAFEVPS